MAATAANHGGRAVVPAASGAARTRWSQWDRKEREAGRVQAERRYGVGGGTRVERRLRGLLLGRLA